MVALVCQEKNGYCGDFCCVASQCSMHCFKTQIGTGRKVQKNHRSVSGKGRKEAFSQTLICPQGLQPGWVLDGRNACPVLKRNRCGKVSNEFSGTTCTLMVKEVPFLNENLSIYSCFIDVLYDLRRILALAFALMSSAAFK